MVPPTDETARFREIRTAIAALFLVLWLGGSYTDAASPSVPSTGLEISLREYVDVRFAAQDAAVKAALEAADRAVEKSELASDKRFESVNEFRRTLADQEHTFMPRSEYEQAHKGLEEKLSALEIRMNSVEERSTVMKEGWGYLVGITGLVIAIVSVAVAAYRRRKVTNEA